MLIRVEGVVINEVETMEVWVKNAADSGNAAFPSLYNVVHRYSTLAS